MHGTRSASRAWGGLVKDTLLADGAVAVDVVPMTFVHADQYIVTIHGDDFIAVGTSQGLDSLNNSMENNIRTKALGRIGPDCEQKSGVFLKRVIEFADGAYWWKPDPRHIIDCIAELGLAGGKAAPTPGTKDTVRNLTDGEDTLSEEEGKKFQRLAGKMLYHSLDDPTVQFDMAMVMSSMSTPTVAGMARLVWVVRHCVDRPTLSGRFELQLPKQKLYVLVDADHASDEVSRKSMSCYHLYFGGHLIETQSARQQSIALSSGESEFYAMSLGCAAGMLAFNCLNAMDLVHLTTTGKPEIYSDSSAARGLVKRSGVGRIKHLETRHLWSQECLRLKLFGLNTVDATMNTADLGTKYLSAATRAGLLAMMPLKFGRLGLAAAVVAQAWTAEASAVAIAQNSPACYSPDTGPYSYWLWMLVVHLVFAVSFFYMAFRIVVYCRTDAKASRGESKYRSDQLKTEAMRGWLQCQRADFLAQILEAQGITIGASRPLKAAMVEFALALGVFDLEHVRNVDSSLPKNIVCLRTLEVSACVKSDCACASLHGWTSLLREDACRRVL